MRKNKGKRRRRRGGGVKTDVKQDRKRHYTRNKKEDTDSLAASKSKTNHVYCRAMLV